MNLAKLLVVGLLGATAFASDAPRGTVPRAAPDKYDAHTVKDGVGIGATLLTVNQARKVFSTNVDRCCIVVEVALYPPKDGITEVSLSDFALRVAGKDIATKPSSAEMVALRLQRPVQPPPPNPDVSGSTSIGWENGGIDPATGRRLPGHTVTTGASVGVGIGGPSQAPRPESTDADRRIIELEFREKGLPEGNTATPVSGYLYFSVAPKKSAKYQLEYTLNGNKITLALR